MNESPLTIPAVRVHRRCGQVPGMDLACARQRDAGRNGIPVVIAQDGLRKFMILNVDDWRDALTPPEPTKEPA